MKLNRTYPLTEMLDALTAASDNPREIAKELDAEGRHMQNYTVYEAENMLSMFTMPCCCCINAVIAIGFTPGTGM